MLHSGVPWVSDGYVTSDCHGNRRSSMPIALLESYHEGTLSVDTQLMLGLRPTTPVVKQQKQRVRSATVVRLQEKEKYLPVQFSGFRGRRPSSATKPQRAPSRPVTPLRTATKSRTVHGRPMSAPVNRPSSTCSSYTDASGISRPRSAAPDFRYLDRHARCLGHDHIHDELYRSRPQMACSHQGPLCPNRDACQKVTRSGEVQAKEADLRTDRHARYIKNMRPRTAPPSLTVVRGYVPHFCNFIQAKSIHDREPYELDDMEGPPVPRKAFEEDDTINYELLDLESRSDGLSVADSTRNDSIAETEEEIESPSPTPIAPQPSKEDIIEDPVPDITQKEKDKKEEENKVKKEEEIKRQQKSKDVAKLDKGGNTSTPSGNQAKSNEKPATPPQKPAAPPGKPAGEKVEKPKVEKVLRFRDPDPVTSYVTDDRDDVLEGVMKSRTPSPIPPPRAPVVQPSTILSSLEEKRRAQEEAASEGDDLKWKTYGLKEKREISVEIPTPRDSPKDDAPKGRACLHKKTRKPIERPRRTREPKETGQKRTKEAEGDQDTAVSFVGSTEPEPEPVPPKIPVPSLPDFFARDKGEEGAAKLASRLARARKYVHMEDPITAVSEMDKVHKPKPKPKPINFEEQVKDDYNNYQKAATRTTNWTQSRLALSNQSCRFELPMDMRSLEDMEPQDYLRNFCFVSSRRHTLYQKIFLKYKDKCGALLIKDLEKGLKEVLVNTISKKNLESIFDMVHIGEESKVDLKLFSGLAAFAERILYPHFLTEDTEDITDHQKEKIECADFCALKWKLNGVEVNPDIRRILEAL